MRTLLKQTALAVTVAFASMPAVSDAQEFPSGPVRIIVPFEAGDAIDGTARLLADLMKDQLQSPVIVQNIPGGGGAAGHAEAQRGEPDGQILLMASTGALTARPLISDAGYQTEDFTPIANIVDVPIALAVGADSPYQSLEELVEAAKKETLTYSTPAPGSTQHVSMSGFAEEHGLNLTHVGGKGGRGAVTKAMSGEVDFVFVGATNYVGLADGGQLRVLGVAAPEPVPYLDAPTFREAGYDFESSVWFGLVVRQDVPQERVEKLRSLVEKAATGEEAEELYKKLNFTPSYMPAEEFQARIDQSVEENRKILGQIGLLQQ